MSEQQCEDPQPHYPHVVTYYRQDGPGTFAADDYRACRGVLPEPVGEVDEARLRRTTDAQAWAEEFAKVRPDVDQGLMIGWFANAIETGRDAGFRAATGQPALGPDALVTRNWIS